MQTLIEVDEHKNLVQINDFVHDSWFSVDDIKYDTNKQLLLIRFLKEDLNKREIIKRFLFFKKYGLPVVEYFLAIYNVTDYNLKDTEKVGDYDFNKITYDPDNENMTIMTGVPLKFSLNVSKFKILIETSSSIVSTKNKWNLD